ncbi:hypothetical protein OJ253_2283 [Cryptosporidium canis]|uniref:U3 small nucleolar RNA-associated protein 11 n=1 Tax=Cryptosporidium canis TaxID=195482 RepID=A0A9D5DFM2_9CRYT|nr:hypothetical protein OJ253_2283 [Cryptosporidium canis]
MSSLKHSIHRRVHLERATPVDRLRFGILERKKDYKVRAKRYHEKENLLMSLSEKARTRNPDEFDFGMVKSRMENGRYKKIDPNPPSGGLTSAEERRLAESQNLTYVNFRKSIDSKKIEKLGKELTLFGQDVPRSHIFFDDDHQDRHASGPPDGQGLSSRPAQLSNEIVKSITKSYKILNDTITRSKSLDRVHRHLELHKNLQSKGRKKKVKTKDGGTEFVWSPKRKK